MANKRLIDANFVKSTIQEVIADDSSEELFVKVAKLICEMLNCAPTVDAVEVVRCKDCKNFVPFVELYHKAGQCRKMVGLVCEDDFCSYRERREGE